MQAEKLSTWLIGDTTRAEFRAVESSNFSDARKFSDLSVALAALRKNQEPPAVLLLAQAWPGQFSHAEVSELRNLAPLARLGTLLGSWLEGEPRTGKPLAGAVRIYWHQWPARGIDVQSSPWSLPITAGDDERWHGNFLSLPKNTDTTIGIVANSRESFSAWRDLFLKLPATSRWLRSAVAASGCTVVLFDVARGDAAELAVLKKVRVKNRGCPIIAVAGFPRAEDVPRLKEAGATAVLSKPFLAAVVLQHINILRAGG